MTNGFDFRDKWAEEIRIIAKNGPFTVDETKALSFQQQQDYFYVTTWVLRQEGEKAFVASREELRGILLRRIERGLPLRPSEQEIAQKSPKSNASDAPMTRVKIKRGIRISRRSATAEDYKKRIGWRVSFGPLWGMKPEKKPEAPEAPTQPETPPTEK
jgi:hypothetical protein